jgi:hypothetical protein
MTIEKDVFFGKWGSLDATSLGVADSILELITTQIPKTLEVVEPDPVSPDIMGPRVIINRKSCASGTGRVATQCPHCRHTLTLSCL